MDGLSQAMIGFEIEDRKGQEGSNLVYTSKIDKIKLSVELTLLFLLLITLLLLLLLLLVK